MSGEWWSSVTMHRSFCDQIEFCCFVAGEEGSFFSYHRKNGKTKWRTEISSFLVLLILQTTLILNAFELSSLGKSLGSLATIVTFSTKVSFFVAFHAKATKWTSTDFKTYKGKFKLAMTTFSWKWRRQVLHLHRTIFISLKPKHKGTLSSYAVFSYGKSFCSFAFFRKFEGGKFKMQNSFLLNNIEWFSKASASCFEFRKLLK